MRKRLGLADFIAIEVRGKDHRDWEITIWGSNQNGNSEEMMAFLGKLIEAESEDHNL